MAGRRWAASRLLGSADVSVRPASSQVSIGEEVVTLGLPPGPVEHARIIVPVDIGRPWRLDPTHQIQDIGV